MINKAWKKRDEKNKLLIALIFIEVSLFFIIFLFLLFPRLDFVLADVVGSPNATVKTILQIGNVYPEILEIIINNGVDNIDLNPNTTRIVLVNITARDFNGEDDIVNVSLRLFDNSISSYFDDDDNNYHYTNSSCYIDQSYGDLYEVRAVCSIPLWYYSNNATWNATVVVRDNASLTDMGSGLVTVNSLLALLLPSVIDYGIVNATEVSEEQIANVTNVGNVMINLSLSGYAVYVGDGLAMNCTLGAIKNISINYERYNLTSSIPGKLNLAEFFGNYTSLTSNPIIKRFNLPQRLNDTYQFIDDTNSSYWRIYVPIGVAGSCSGNIVFGAVRSPEV